MAGKVLTDQEFDKCIEGCAIGAKGRLIAHNAVLTVTAREGKGADIARDSIVAWLFKECGDQTTVRANHTRKLANLIQNKEDLK